MRDLSIQDVMNTVARQLEKAPRRDPSAPRQILSELEIFASIDPLLGDLQRQYKDARYNRRMHEKTFGADDPMTDVARDTEDSAWCAMQTRFMETRGDRDMMRQMQAIQCEQHAEERREKEQEQQRNALDTFYRADTMMRMKKQAKTPVIYEWLIVLWLMHQRGDRFSIAPGFARFAA